MSKPILLLDLEEKLMADRDGEFRVEMLTELLAMQSRLATQRRLLNDRQRYLDIVSALRAVSAAITILRNLFVPLPQEKKHTELI